MSALLPAVAEIVVAVLLVGSGLVVLVAALGLWRLPDFFLRMHAPALASTLAAWIVTLGAWAAEHRRTRQGDRDLRRRG